MAVRQLPVSSRNYAFRPGSQLLTLARIPPEVAAKLKEDLSALKGQRNWDSRALGCALQGTGTIATGT
ncbi:MAG: hypothetical protein RL514_1170 [Verrucomicrobiota bacterium]|jgi:hypothetical protein